MSLEIKVDTSQVTQELEAVQKSLLDKEALNQAAADAVKPLVESNLVTNYKPRDKDGILFWHRAIDSIETSVTPDSGTVAITQVGVRLRYYGGAVTPGKSISSFTGKLTRALAIPSKQVPVNDGRRIPPFRAGLLAFHKAKKGAPADTIGYLLRGVQAIATRGKNKGEAIVKAIPKEQGGGLMFVLRKKTTHKPDPGVLPKSEDMAAAATKGIAELLD